MKHFVARALCSVRITQLVDSGLCPAAGSHANTSAEEAMHARVRFQQVLRCLYTFGTQRAAQWCPSAFPNECHRQQNEPYSQLAP